MIRGVAYTAGRTGNNFRLILCRICIAIPALLFLPSLSALSADNYTAGAGPGAMAGVSVMCSGFHSIWQNQAGLGFYRQMTFGVHHENRFMVRELALSAIGFTLPTPTGTLGLSWTRFGYARYHENKFGLALGKAFHDRFSAGLQLNYLYRFIDSEIRNTGSLALEAGIMAEPLEGLQIGVHLFNPSGSGEGVPVILRLGLGYRFDSRLFMGVETERSLGFPVSVFRAGAEYRVNDYIYLRTGISIQYYVSHSFGMGFQRNKLRANLAVTVQQVAGYTPSLSLGYHFR